MCDDHWQQANAEVVCGQLGYPTSSATIFMRAYFGQGIGLPILMDNVACVGTESFLINCSFTSYHDCGHHEDAGVRCGGTFALLSRTVVLDM